MTAVLGKLVLWLFAADGALSLLHEALACGEACGVLAGGRGGVAWIVLVCSQVALCWWLVVPRLPAMVALVPATFLLWALLGALPLSLVVSSAQMPLVLSALQCLLGGLLFAADRHRRGGNGRVTGRGSLGRSLALSLAVVVVSAVAVVVHLPVMIVAGMQNLTDGYVAFDRGAVLVERRRFEAEGRRVELLGMVHLGEAQAYERLFSGYATPGTVVLVEGVTDRNGRLGTMLSYDALASLLGLTAQPPVQRMLARAGSAPGDSPGTDAALAHERAKGAVQQSPAGLAGARGADVRADRTAWPHVQHADVDAGAFSEATVLFLNRVGELVQVRSIAALAELLLSDIPPEVLDDLITLRNETLIAELDTALQRYEQVVVPWGALHLPDVEASLESRGFRHISTRQHVLIQYGTLVRAVVRSLERTRGSARRGPDGRSPALP
jgi:hypothetical protein